MMKSRRIERALEFHRRRRQEPRRVMMLANGTYMSAGQLNVLCASGFGGLSAYMTGVMPWWGILIAAAGGFLGGKFLFPIPDMSAASPRGPRNIVLQHDGELDRMTPQEMAVYKDNVDIVLGPDPWECRAIAWEVFAAMRRQRNKARTIARETGASFKTMSGISLTGLDGFAKVLSRHQELKYRWLAYEIDPRLQIDFPAMADPTQPATALMIRAMKAADNARSTTDLANYEKAVNNFAAALSKAEINATNQVPAEGGGPNAR